MSAAHLTAPKNDLATSRPQDGELLVSQRGFLLTILFLKIALDLGYRHFVAVVYAYAGFEYVSSVGRVVVSYVATFVLALFVGRLSRHRRPSSVGLLVIFSMLIVPILSYWAMAGVATSAMLLFICSFILTLGAMTLPLPSPYRLRAPILLPILMALTVGLIAFAVILGRGGLRFASFSFSQVYEFREDIYNQVVFGFAGYLVPWYGKSAGILLMCLAAFLRRWLVLAALIGAHVVLFGLTSNKEYAFYPLAVILVLDATRSRIGNRVALVFALTATLAGTLYAVWGNVLLPAVLLTRVFFAQALNSFAYYDFFQFHDPIVWSNSFLSTFFTYPFSQRIPEIIGAGRYGADSAAFANTGYLGSAYMQFGAIGVLLYGLVGGLLLRLFDVMSGKRLPLSFGASLAFVGAAQFVNTDLTIALLSGGVFLSYALLFLLRVGMARPRLGSRHVSI